MFGARLVATNQFSAGRKIQKLTIVDLFVNVWASKRA
jgi:hypothetical protein